MPGSTAIRPLPHEDDRPAGLDRRYVEEEWVIEGRADAFDPDGILIDGDVAYVTRFLIRRPADPGQASGTVFLDPLHMIDEMPASWDCGEWMMGNGHVWVGVTVHTSSFGALYGFVGGIDAVKESDPSRYTDLHLATFERPPALRSHQGPSGTDSYALKWNMAMAHPQGHGIVADVATILRTHPDFAALGVRRIYACGVSQTANFWRLFVDGGWHDRRRDSAGSPLFDAYVLLVSSAPALRPVDGLLVNVLSEAEVVGTLVNPAASPPDSDRPRVRGIELPGAPHTIGHADVEDPGRGHLHTSEPYVLAVKAVFAGVEHWVRDGVPMPHVPRIARDPATVDGIVRDQFGNAVGGLRLPWLEAPRAQYLPRCACGPTLGEATPFADERIRQLYRDDAAHEDLWRRAVLRLVEDRHLLSEDTEAMLAHRATSGPLVPR